MSTIKFIQIHFRDVKFSFSIPSLHTRMNTILFISAFLFRNTTGTYPTNVVVRSNGSCLYVPPGIFKSTCKIDITWFPFDDQRCEMKFGMFSHALRHMISLCIVRWCSINIDFIFSFPFVQNNFCNIYSGSWTYDG